MEATMTPMTYNQIIDKINRVFDSCTNRFQIVTAEMWCKKCVRKYYNFYECSGDSPTISEEHIILMDYIKSKKSRVLKEW